mmetsp:Transcript_24612/g.68560  ORF Transcript_24612/g.68560 Transcript_24612/m.68560 type:complete len:295 (+) Transcript_24612:91-975(+)
MGQNVALHGCGVCPSQSPCGPHTLCYGLPRGRPESAEVVEHSAYQGRCQKIDTFDPLLGSKAFEPDEKGGDIVWLPPAALSHDAVTIDVAPSKPCALRPDEDVPVARNSVYKDTKGSTYAWVDVERHNDVGHFSHVLASVAAFDDNEELSLNEQREEMLKAAERRMIEEDRRQAAARAEKERVEVAKVKERWSQKSGAGGVSADDRECVEKFLEKHKFKGVDVPRKKKDYPLHVAVTVCDADMVKLLLSSKASPFARNGSNQTAVDVAAKVNKNGSHDKINAMLRFDMALRCAE